MLADQEYKLLFEYCKPDNSRLVDNGPYPDRIHPMYGGWIIVWITTGFVSGSPTILILTILISIGQMIAAFFEEIKLSISHENEWKIFSKERKVRFFKLWETITLFILLFSWVVIRIR